MRPHRRITVNPMRTTLDIDDDVLLAAKERARKEKISTGAALTLLARAGLNPSTRTPGRGRRSPLGITPLPGRGEVITNEHINRLRDELDV
jgi:hypothetical protein